MDAENTAFPDLTRVVSDPAICGGRPVIRGTRMRVVDILDMLAEGVTIREILDDFYYITEADVFAALAYAAATVGKSRPAGASSNSADAHPAPPPAVANQAPPHAFASSLTRRI